MKKITNEVKFVKMAIKDKNIGDKPSETIKLIAKHHLGKGLSIEETKTKVISFMKLALPDTFKLSNWEETIDKILKSTKKYKSYVLVEVDSINITKSELEIINSLENINLEKLAFTLLVHSKVSNAMKNNKGNWVNSSIQEISQDADLSGSTKIQRPLRHELLNRGLIAAPRVGSITVKFVNEESDVILVIEDFKDFINEYLKWKGVIKSIKCKNDECIKLIEVTSNSKKYCSECAKLKRNENQKSRDIAKRNKK